MPTIALYGAKGGTGRTTAAAAIAQGMLARGMYVTLVETDTGDDPLARWWAAFENPSYNEGDLDYRRCTTPAEIDLLLRIAPSDDRHAIIFDTSPRISAVRSYAFERAHLVLMPFTGSLDADIGIAKATSQLPASTTLKALPVRAPTDLSIQVSEWMPVLESALPDDERLVLFSEASNRLLKEMPATMYPDYHLMRSLPDRLFNLGLEATEFVPGPDMAQIKQTPARALTDDSACLGVPA
ncbi:MAG: hypothetical protein ABJN14_17020 [Paracoccaceae bacterium]